MLPGFTRWIRNVCSRILISPETGFYEIRVFLQPERGVFRGGVGAGNIEPH